MAESSKDLMRKRRDELRDELRAKLPKDLLGTFQEYEAAAAYVHNLELPLRSGINYEYIESATTAIYAFLRERGEKYPLDSIREACIAGGYKSDDTQREFRSAVSAHLVGRKEGKYRRWLFVEEPAGIIALAEWHPELVAEAEARIDRPSQPDVKKHQRGRKFWSS